MIHCSNCRCGENELCDCGCHIGAAFDIDEKGRGAMIGYMADGEPHGYPERGPFLTQLLATYADRLMYMASEARRFKAMSETENYKLAYAEIEKLLLEKVTSLEMKV